MSVVMVGPFPGPFDRSHYSDSCSGEPDRRPAAPIQRSRSGAATAAAARPAPRFAEGAGAAADVRNVHRDVVAYSTVRKDYGASSPAYAPMPNREPRHESLPEPPRPRRASLKRKCHALLCRLAVVALCLIAVAVLVVAVSRSMRVRADTAPVKGGSAAVRPANGTDHRGGIGIRDTSSTQAVALAAVGRPRARSTARLPAETRHYKRRHGETADHEPPALRRQSDVTTAPPSGVLMERAAVRTSFEADGTAALLTASLPVASMASKSPAAVFSGGETASNGERGDR
ncbi:hypothetical protein MRX96_014498 [Rhipicephalus microplus]